jgi:serine/threonine-protein kinase
MPLPTDRRADIWAFGVVLYEMVTGERLFEGETVSDSLAAVLSREPDLKLVPERTRLLLRRCLEKDPKRRLRDIGDAMPLLETTFSAAPNASLAKVRLPWIAVAVLAIALGIALWALWRIREPVDRTVVRLDVNLGADVSLPGFIDYPGSKVVISPDGTRVAYVSGTPRKLFTRRLDQPKATELPGTEAASVPFFSPDGQWIGFYSYSNGRLNKISVEGGGVVPLGEDAAFAGASWGEDGGILVSEAFGRGLLRFPDGGGKPETIAGRDNGELSLASPQILPGGRAILFVAATAAGVDKDTIEVLTLPDRQRKIVAGGGLYPRYPPTSGRVGHLVYLNKGTLFAVPFDLDKLETRGTAVPVLDDVGYDSTTGGSSLCVDRGAWSWSKRRRELGSLDGRQASPGGETRGIHRIAEAGARNSDAPERLRRTAAPRTAG